MPREHVTAVIFDENQQVVLILREDFRIWALPGGMIEPGETPEQTAIRETLEETGYLIAVDRYIGKYLRPQFNDVRHVFRGHVIGGQSLENGPETLQVKWFSLDGLPTKRTPHVQELIQDTIADAGAPLEKVQRMPFRQVLLIRFMVKLRDLRSLLTHKP
jgi:8-oxo-dGTP pyrophosphatase MutT (NUDIX family)